ncbi:hypothetical protein DPMN_172062 [Dreissena polymorpha]|uniref:Uncharacterized protein n=1 Tax=Dreissena polymorpha TaxID=45954 RepID=A0A9D4DZ49_DREPO|nr:hypothetical protein DPMN_172062 [Dreissena polymorpha]
MTTWYRRRLSRSVYHNLRLSVRSLGTFWECQAPFETVWETSWYRRRLFMSV